MMTGDDVGLQGLFSRMRTTAWRRNTFKRMYLQIDDRNLANGMYRSGHDRQLYQPPPHRPPPHHPPVRYHLQHPQFNEFSYEEELRGLIYHYNDDFED